MTARTRTAPLIAMACLGLASCNTIAAIASPKAEATVEALKPGTYTLDKSHAALTFTVNHLGFSDYVGRFNSFDATMDFDADNPQAARVEAVIDVASLDVNNPDFAKELTGPDWLDAEQFPQAGFRSTRIEITGKTTGRMTGELTLHGVTKPITLDVTFNGGDQDALRGAYITGFSASGIFDRTAFGVSKYAGPIGREIIVQIEAEFMKQ